MAVKPLFDHSFSYQVAVLGQVFHGKNGDRPKEVARGRIDAFLK